MQDAQTWTVGDVMHILEAWAPPSLQESYDNAGLIVGHPDDMTNGVLVSLDCTEEVVDEAMSLGLNMIVSHHPIVFGGLKRFTGQTYVERTVMKAIRNGIAIYAAHTNLDNVMDGVNHRLATSLGCLPDTLRILRPKPETLMQIVVYGPEAAMQVVQDAMFLAGAGKVGHYDECGWAVAGQGTFRPLEGADPHIGQLGRREQLDEVRFEVVVEPWKLNDVLRAMRESHPYEEVAHGVWTLQNVHRGVGSGMIGRLSEPVSEEEFLESIKQALGCQVIRHTQFLGKKVQRVAVCGGSGSFLLPDAKRAGADVFVTSDFKYHEFFDADGSIVIADVGHYESEWQTTDLIANRLKENFTNFAVHLAKANPNPIHYR